MYFIDNFDGLEYCKKGIHRYLPVNRHGDLRCVECGHSYHKCDLRCKLHYFKCESPKEVNENKNRST